MSFQGCFGLDDGTGAVAENKSYSPVQARGEPHAVATASQASMALQTWFMWRRRLCGGQGIKHNLN